jgi:hypothetical protein
MQKRHWMATVWAGHIGLDELDDDLLIIEELQKYWEELRDAPGLRYAIGQIERSPQTGRLHIQAYTEWQRSLRVSEVNNRFSAHLEPRLGSRDDARDYCRKATWRGKEKGQVLRLVEIGKWRSAKSAKESPKQRALYYLKQGLTPEQILVKDPDVYFTHYRAINAVNNLMQSAGICILTTSEEE